METKILVLKELSTKLSLKSKAVLAMHFSSSSSLINLMFKFLILSSSYIL